jgi:hypothetical protein
MYRSKKLLDAARGQECSIRLPNICNNNPETVVAAHSNQLRHGKGGGLKAHDCFVAWACYACHAELDQGNRFRYDEKIEYWQRGFEETLLQMFLQNIVKVS